MITKTQYQTALGIIKDYKKQQKKRNTKPRPKVVPADIDTVWKGFKVEKIKDLSDQKLSELERELTDKIDTCEYANIEEYRYLTVAWLQKLNTTPKEINKICKIINLL